MFILRESIENGWHFSRFFVTCGTAVVQRDQLHWGGNPTCVWPRNPSPNQINFEVTDRLSSNFVFCVSVWESFRANMAVVRTVGSERMRHEKYDHEMPYGARSIWNLTGLKWLSLYSVRFQVLTAVLLKTWIFWGVTGVLISP